MSYVSVDLTCTLPTADSYSTKPLCLHTIHMLRVHSCSQSRSADIAEASDIFARSWRVSRQKIGPIKASGAGEPQGGASQEELLTILSLEVVESDSDCSWAVNKVQHLFHGNLSRTSIRHAHCHHTRTLELVVSQYHLRCSYGQEDHKV